MRNLLFLSSLALGQIAAAQDITQNADVTKALLKYDYSMRLAKKRFAEDLEAAQRQALQNRHLDEAVSVQKLRVQITKLPIPSREELEFRKALDGTEWAYGTSWSKQSEIKFTFTKTHLYWRERGNLRFTREYEYLPPLGFQYGSNRFLLNKDMTRFYMIGSEFSLRKGVKVK